MLVSVLTSQAPFKSATLFSNGILANAPTAAEKEAQFDSVATAAGIDPSASDAVAQLRRVSISTLLASIGANSSQMVFRGVIGPGDGWVSEDQMEYQQSGRFASDLRKAGIQYVVCGDVRDEVRRDVVFECNTRHIQEDLMRTDRWV